MANRSLGTLTIDLLAKTGGFVSGLDQAQRASRKWATQVEEDAARAIRGLAGITGAAIAVSGGVATAGYSLLKTTSKQISESDRWAKSLNMSTQELLAWQFAAEKAGVSGDQMADIFKDIGDKIGDAVLNKSGEAVSSLDALGLSAKKLSAESPDQQLLAIGDALGKIKTNSEKTNILEGLGNDLSKLLPLFDNNNEKLKQFISLAKDYGVAPNPSSIDDLVRINSIFEDMEAQVKGLKIEIAAGLAKADLSPLQSSLNDVHDVLTDPKVLQGIANLVSEIAQLAGWMIKAAAAAGDLAATSSNRMAAIGGNINEKNLGEVEERIKYLNATMADRSENVGFWDKLFNVDASAKSGREELAKLQKVAEQLRKQREESQKPSIKSPAANDYQLPTGETNGKPKADPRAAEVKKLQSAYQSLELSYQRQIALIDTSGKKTADVTELEKLRFDISTGKLTGLNNAQKTRLEQLATEVDRLNAVKKANEENLKLASFTANLRRSNENSQSGLDSDIVGYGLGDKERDRMRERLDIEKDFLDRRRDLQESYQNGDITKSLYDRETAALQSALNERLAMQEDHYKKLDDLQNDWGLGAKQGLANWMNDAENYSGQVSDFVGSTMDGLVDTMSDALSGNKADWAEWGMDVLKTLQKILLNALMVNAIKSFQGSDIMGLFGGASSAGESSGTALSSFGSNFQFNAKGGVYTSSDLSAYSGQIVNSPTMFAFAKGAGLMGEAGPEAIMPLTRAGDGSLGVRMVGGNQGASAGSTQITQHITVSGNGDAALRQAMQQAARQGANDGAKQARQEMLQDFQTRGQGRRLLGV